MSGYELHWATAHMLTPLSILKQPWAPQLAPHEFLMFQNFTPLSTPKPVAKTAWLTSWVVLPQLDTEQTPPAQFLNPAITWKDIAMGPALQSRSASSTSFPCEILQLPCLQQATEISGLWTQGLVLAAQGQVISDSRPPMCLMYSKAWDGRPPLQPWLSKSPAQSTSCCSEKVRFLPLPRMFQWDSMAPTVEKVQHDPHAPWFLTGETIPQSFHSQLSGMAASRSSAFTLMLLVAEQFWGSISLSLLNSSKVISDRSLMPCLQLWLPALWVLISLRVSKNTLNLQSDLSKLGDLKCMQISWATLQVSSSGPSSMFLYLMLRWRLAEAKLKMARVSMIFDIISKLNTKSLLYYHYKYLKSWELDRMFIKVATGFALGLQVLIFAMLPYFNSKTFTNKRIVNAFNNFSAGLFLGISFLHIIPQANHSISHWLQSSHPSMALQQPVDHKHQIPFGSLISLITFLFVIGIEVYMNDGLSSECAGEKRTNSHMHEVLSSQKLKMRRRLMLETYLTQLALSIHSLFQCISVGVQKRESVVITLAGAIIFHKWAQALTLGFSYSVSGMPKQTAFRFALFHSFLNFAAVIIGYQLSETSELVKGITNGISGGTFIYISMIQKISKNFENKEELFPKLGLILAGLCSSLLILH